MSDQTNQEWSLNATDDGYYSIVNRYSGKVLDDTN
ncbi:RICIN domain-containing protein [Ktedonobacter racemifer]|nr:RICIN domain-containing protein [Ktedonobacter racemifer]